MISTDDKIIKFITKCKVLGYLSKIEIYKTKYVNLLTQLKMEQVQLINDNISNIDLIVLKKIVIPISNNPWYIEGINNFNMIQSKIIKYYNESINNIVETEKNNELKYSALINEIIAIDKFYNIYEDTIEFSSNINLKFKDLMSKKFNKDIYI